MTARVLLLATLATKAEEVAYFRDRLSDHNVEVALLDVSLQSTGAVLDGPGKVAAMNLAVDKAVQAMSERIAGDVNAVVGLGGGTGGEIILRAMRSLPITFPKILVTTLPFDPRIALADNSIVLVPTLSDLCGLNATLREVLENAAAMTAGLCLTRRAAGACVETPSVGITALGATEAAILPLVGQLRARGQEATVFHANGYGGAAFARFAERGAFHTIIDLTPHELTRMMIAGAHVDMPTRFTAGADLPRIVLPGGLNFIGLGEAHLMPTHFLDRPHYAHSSYFTHVQVLPDEMVQLADQLVAELNSHKGPCHLIVPMGGFSHQDRPGGAIDAPELREVFLERAREGLSSDVALTCVDAHISEALVTEAIIAAHDTLPSQPNEARHA